jgi:hypothetical protein
VSQWLKAPNLADVPQSLRHRRCNWSGLAKMSDFVISHVPGSLNQKRGWLWARRPGFESQQGLVFSLPPRLNRVRDPSSLLSKGYSGKVQLEASSAADVNNASPSSKPSLFGAIPDVRARGRGFSLRPYPYGLYEHAQYITAFTIKRPDITIQ